MKTAIFAIIAAIALVATSLIAIPSASALTQSTTQSSSQSSSQTQPIGSIGSPQTSIQSIFQSFCISSGSSAFCS